MRARAPGADWAERAFWPLALLICAAGFWARALVHPTLEFEGEYDAAPPLSMAWGGPIPAFGGTIGFVKGAFGPGTYIFRSLSYRLWPDPYGDFLVMNLVFFVGVLGIATRLRRVLHPLAPLIFLACVCTSPYVLELGSYLHVRNWTLAFSTVLLWSLLWLHGEDRHRDVAMYLCAVTVGLMMQTYSLGVTSFIIAGSVVLLSRATFGIGRWVQTVLVVALMHLPYLYVQSSLGFRDILGLFQFEARPSDVSSVAGTPLIERAGLLVSAITGADGHWPWIGIAALLVGAGVCAGAFLPGRAPGPLRGTRRAVLVYALFTVALLGLLLVPPRLQLSAAVPYVLIAIAADVALRHLRWPSWAPLVAAVALLAVTLSGTLAHRDRVMSYALRAPFRMPDMSEAGEVTRDIAGRYALQPRAFMTEVHGFAFNMTQFGQRLQYLIACRDGCEAEALPSGKQLVIVDDLFALPLPEGRFTPIAGTRFKGAEIASRLDLDAFELDVRRCDGEGRQLELQHPPLLRYNVGRHFMEPLSEQTYLPLDLLLGDDLEHFHCKRFQWRGPLRADSSGEQRVLTVLSEASKVTVSLDGQPLTLSKLAAPGHDEDLADLMPHFAPLPAGAGTLEITLEGEDIFTVDVIDMPVAGLTPRRPDSPFLRDVTE